MGSTAGTDGGNRLLRRRRDRRSEEVTSNGGGRLLEGILDGCVRDRKGNCIEDVDINDPDYDEEGEDRLLEDDFEGEIDDCGERDRETGESLEDFDGFLI